MAERLAVVVDGQVAGIARRDGRDGASFEYEEAYASDPARTPLSLSVPLGGGRRPIWWWMDNLLPDDEELRRRWGRMHGCSSTDPMDLLATPIGHDCAGAVQFCDLDDVAEVLQRPSGIEPMGAQQVARWLHHLRTTLGPLPDPDAPLSFSLAGAQAKIALRRHEGGWARPVGNEPSSHILKIELARFPDNDIIEHVCQTAARRMGLAAARTEMLGFGDQRAVCVERFDRLLSPAGTLARLHQEDCMQALGLPGRLKFQRDDGPTAADISTLLRNFSQTPERCVRRFRDALIFNWIIGGSDAHAKNYSLLLDGPAVRMAPLYDLCSALPYLHPMDHIGDMAMAMSIGKAHLLRDADSRAAWRDCARDLRLPPDETLDRVEELTLLAAGAFEEASDTLPRQARASMRLTVLRRAIDARLVQCREALSKGATSPSPSPSTDPKRDA